MKLNKLKTITVAAIFATVLALGAVASQAVTLTVGNATSLPCTGTFLTIQSAITAASPGDTISVCPGTYNEQVQITKTLIVQGAQQGVDARTRATTSESIINNSCAPVQILADNVILDGFTVQGSAMTNPCLNTGIWTNPGFSGTQGGHQILNNIVQNNISGIELDSTCAANPTLVQHNLIQNNNNPGPGSGNAIQVNFGLCNATIDSNKFSGHTNSSILVSNFNGADTNITVSSNELVGGTSTSERIVMGGVTNSAITGNTSIGSTALNGPIRLFGGDSNITINSNVLRNGVRGIRIDDPFGVGPNSGISGHLNCITGNSVAGLDVPAGGYSGILNAENNWWGSATGPTIASNPGGTGDKIIDPDGVVDYSPFLTSDATTPCATPPCPTPGCTTNKKDCHKFVEQQEKDFNDMQKAQKKNFDSQPHTKQEKKTFDDQQKTAKDAFQTQYKANEMQCNQLPK